MLLNLETAAYHGLNETGSLIWETVGAGMTIGELVPQVATHFDDAPPSLHEEIGSFVQDLVERDLLQVDHPVTTSTDEPGDRFVNEGGEE